MFNHQHELSIIILKGGNDVNVEHSVTEEFLKHYGIKGMKWGVRRTPQQLGHAVAKKASSGEKKASKVTGNKTTSRAFRKSTSISDEELQKRINRLNMEERYEDLVFRQNARNNKGFKTTAKKLLANSAEDLGRQLLSKAVSKLVDRISGDKKFNIDDYKDMDVSKMDSDTIAKVSKWYGDAMKISTARSKLAPEPSSSNSSSSSTYSRSSSKSKSSSPSARTDYTKRPAWGSTSDVSRRQMDEWIRQRNRAISELRR